MKINKILIVGAAVAVFAFAASAYAVPAGNPSLSQTNVTLGLGQTVTIYSQGDSTAVYLANVSSPGIASIQANGTQITIVGNQLGSTTANICYAGTASNCTAILVTVQAGGAIAFSQNNLTIAVGQSVTMTVSGGNGTYSITSNSNGASVTTALSGTTITLTAAALGNATIGVCDGAGNCGTIYATAAGSAPSGSLTFSAQNPSVMTGQTITDVISGGSGYYISSNSSPNIASEILNGSTLTIAGLSSGATTMTICSSSNGCGSVLVTVTGVTANGQVSFGVPSPTVNVGGTLNVPLSGGSSYYVSTNPSTNILQATVNGTMLALSGVSAGSDSITVCISGGNCNPLYVNVQPASSASTAATTTQTTNTSPSTTGTAPSGSSVSGSTSAGALIAAIQSMQNQLAQILTQIQTMATTLTQLAGNMNVPAATGGTAPTATAGTSLYTFDQFLGVGSQGPAVTALQQYLSQKGFYSGDATGFYGTATQAAVEKYQKAHSLPVAGYVGPSTRAALNAGE